MTTVLAIGVGNAILAWLALAIGLVGAVAAVVLLTRVVRQALEIERYAGAILEAGLGIARNTDGLDELNRTGQLAAAVPELASDYLSSAGRT